jgi:hypothetical protein
VDEEENVPYVLHSKVEKATKKTMEKNATTDDNVPVGRRRSQNNEATLNYIHETGEWPKDVTEVSLKEAESYKMPRLSHNQAHRSYSKDSSEDT